MTGDQAAESLERLLGREALARIEAPTEAAASLPNAAYTSEAFLALENRRLFARTWMLAGFRHQVPRPGDVAPASVAGLPIILVHGPDGEVRAFHNVCRHRGARLVSRPCSGLRTLLCPYHAWTYGLDGRLRARPHFHGAGRHDAVRDGDDAPGLVPLRCAAWLDLIFVNVSGDAPPLERHLAPMTDRLAGYELSALRYAGKISCEIEANWKFIHENFIETYHVFAVHPKLTAFVPMEARTPSAFDGLCFWNEYRFPAPESGRGAGLPYYPDLPADRKRRGLWFHFFPTVDIELWPDQFAVFHVTPLGPGRTREDIHVYLIGDAADAEAHREAREAVFEMWRSLNNEDVRILELLQQGRQSPAYDGGCFSTHWEKANHHFARLIVEGIR